MCNSLEFSFPPETELGVVRECSTKCLLAPETGNAAKDRGPGATGGFGNARTGSGGEPVEASIGPSGYVFHYHSPYNIWTLSVNSGLWKDEG